MIAESTFSSDLPLFVGWIDADGGNDPCGGGEHKLGATTMGGRTVDVPENRVWYVEPRHGVPGAEWPAVIDEVRQRRIPGLSAGHRIDDNELAEIGKLDHLEHLDLSGCAEITDDGLLKLAGLANLRRIHLVNCRKLTDRGLAVLANFPRLSIARLDRIPDLTDAGVAHLANHQDLQLVGLTATGSGDGALRALKGKPGLTHLSPGDATTDAGLAELPGYPGLTEYREDGPKHQVIEYSPPTVSSLSFDLRGGMPITNKGLVHLAALKGIFEFSLGHQSESSVITGAAAAHVAAMENVRILKWAEGICDDEAVTHVAGMPNVRDFICFNNVCTDEGFSRLADCANLHYVLAQRCDKLTVKSVEALSRLPNLEQLNFGGALLDDDSLEPLPRYPALRIMNPTFYGDEAYRHVGRVTRLQRLTNMYCNDTGDRATEYISGLPSLVRYSIWGTQITDRSLELLGRMKSLEDILIYKCPHLTDAGLSHLKALPNLEKLDLQRCERLSEEGVRDFRADVSVNFQPA